MICAVFHTVEARHGKKLYMIEVLELPENASIERIQRSLKANGLGRTEVLAWTTRIQDWGFYEVCQVMAS